MVKEPTAILILTGNELLTGKIEDANGKFVIKKSRVLGLRLIGLFIIPDTVEHIAAMIRQVKQIPDVSFIFVSGGIGPTHDDVTLEGIAKALEKKLELDAQFENALRRLYADHWNENLTKMAKIPESAELLWEDKLVFPVIKIENIYCFPGSPKFFARSFDAVSARFAVGHKFFTAKIETTLEEQEIAKILDSLQKTNPELLIGSYPQYEKNWWTLVTIDGTSKDKIDKAVKRFVKDVSDLHGSAVIKNISYAG